MVRISSAQELEQISSCLAEYIEQGWPTYGTRAKKGMWNDIPGRRLSLLFEIFITSFAQPASLYLEEHVYIYSDMSDTVHTVYELPLLPNNTAV